MGKNDHSFSVLPHEAGFGVVHGEGGKARSAAWQDLNYWRNWDSVTEMKPGYKFLSSIVRTLVFLAAASRVSAATLTFSSVADTSLYENNPDFNLGATTLLSGTNQKVSRSKGLFQFDVSSLPAGAVVTGVEVRLYCTRQPDPDQHGGPVASDFSLHRMLVSWGEGSSGATTGSVAMAGDATWNERHNQAIAWGTPGGLAGADYAGAASATTSVGNVGLYAWGSSTELISDVEAWRADPLSNFGFILVNQSESSPGSGRRFASREQSSELAPAAQLIVTYAIPEPSGAMLIGLAVVGAGLRRRVTAR